MNENDILYESDFEKEGLCDVDESKRLYCPRWLDDEAKKEWRRLGPTLIKIGLLNDLTYSSFAAYCQEWSRYQKAESFINEKGPIMKDGRGGIKEIPQVTIAYRALRAMHRAATAVGFGNGDLYG